MCRPNSVLLFPVLLVLLINEAAQLTFKRFHCDSAEKASRLKNLEFERILVKNHTVYLVASSREVFRFRVPILFEDGGRVFRLTGPFYEAKLESALPGERPLGYYLKGSTTSEIKGFKDEKFSKFLELNELNAGDSFALGPRRKIKLRKSLFESLSRMNFGVFFERKNSLLILSTGQNFSFLRVFQLLNETSLNAYNTSISSYVPFNQNVNFFLYDELEEMRNRTLLYVERNAVHMYRVENLLDEDKLSIQFKLHQDPSNAEFFGCPVNEVAAKPGLLKGIFYFNKVFFLFINHCHLKIEEDLVERQFDLRKDYFKNVRCLSTREVYYGFENIASKYVKTIRGGALLVLSAGETYELSVQQNELAITPADQSKYRSFAYPNCLGQTLSLTKIFFCFNETAYHAMLSPKNGKGKQQSYQIADLFANMDIYPNGEELQCTFDYKQDEFVLMTKKYLFAIKYRAVRVDMDSYRILLDDRKFVRRTENRLFGGVRRVTTSTPAGNANLSTVVTGSPGETTDETSGETTKVYHKAKYNLISLMLLGLFGMFILLTLLFYIVNYVRKQANRRPDPDMLKAFMISRGGSAAKERASKSRLSNPSNGSVHSAPFVPSTTVNLSTNLKNSNSKN